MKLLINESPLQVLPSLATAIGLNKAIVLQYIHCLLQSDFSYYREKRPWIKRSFEDWQTCFPFWSKKTIRRIFKELEREGLILATIRFNASKFDRTKWYTINYEKLNLIIQGGNHE